MRYIERIYHCNPPQTPVLFQFKFVLVAIEGRDFVNDDSLRDVRLVASVVQRPVRLNHLNTHRDVTVEVKVQVGVFAVVKGSVKR